MEQSGGTMGIHSLSALESALAQPRMTFGGEELYPTVVEKASALGFSFIKLQLRTTHISAFLTPARHLAAEGRA